eukprot:m.73935 g.73935  ORF g.73935 m.73935 type:complete len:265 (-) comp14346_c0_seq9:2037-2831(-)
MVASALLPVLKSANRHGNDLAGYASVNLLISTTLLLLRALALSAEEATHAEVNEDIRALWTSLYQAISLVLEIEYTEWQPSRIMAIVAAYNDVIRALDNLSLPDKIVLATTMVILTMFLESREPGASDKDVSHWVPLTERGSQFGCWLVEFGDSCIRFVHPGTGPFNLCGAVYNAIRDVIAGHLMVHNETRNPHGRQELLEVYDQLLDSYFFLGSVLSNRQHDEGCAYPDIVDADECDGMVDCMHLMVRLVELQMSHIRHPVVD